MAAVRKFVETFHPESWEFTLKLYDDVLKEKASKKSKPSAAKELKDLDKWYQEELPLIIKERNERYITTEELVQLMKWKLSRGKFRPRLVELAGNNPDEDVRSKSIEAFKKLDKGNLKGAIDCLSQLKGIGPATASGILTAGMPEKAAFMSDEPTLAILGEGSLKYNTQEYLAYMDGINNCVKKLNEKAKSSTWTPHRVELTLWTYYLANKLKPELIDTLKRKSDTNNEEQSVKKQKK